MEAKIFKDGTVITFDDVTQTIVVLSRASVLVVGDRIAAIADEEEALSLPDGISSIESIDIAGKILAPGFINTHVHSWQTVYRTLGPNVILANYFDWLSQISPTAVKAFTPEDIYISSLEGYLEGINAGVTSYVEHAHNNWDGAVVKPSYQAAVDSKTRVWWCYDIASRPDFPVEEQWGIISEIAAKISLAKATEAATERVCLGLSLDGLSGSSFGDAIQEIGVKAKQLGVQAFTMHHMGGPWPQGNSSPANMGKQGLPDAGIPIIFSHAPFLTDEDMSALREHEMFVSITPESECHFGHGQVTGKLISDHASLGLDTSWTFSGDMIGQARLWLQTVRNNSYTKILVEKEKLPNMNPMTVEQAFLLATRQGARALRRDDIGVLQVGAKADLVVFNGDSPNMLGWSDPVAAVILHANSGDVQHVLVGGEFRKRDFELVVDVPGGWSGVRDRFVEAAQRIQVQVKTPPSLPDKLWGIGELGDVEISTTARIIDG